MIDRIFSEIRSYLPKTADTQTQRSTPDLGRQAFRHEPEQFTFEDSSNFRPAAVSPSGNAFGDLSDVAPLQMGSAVPAAEQTQSVGDRIELGLPDGKLSLPETLANLDAALTVLWARRQLVAAVDAADGRPTPAPPRDFTEISQSGL
jgi:hypothetical protein